MPPAIAAIGAIASAVGSAAGAGLLGTGLAEATIGGISASTLLTIGGTALGVAGTAVQAGQQQQAAVANQKAADIESQNMIAVAGENARRQRERNAEATSTQIAKLGAVGVDVNLLDSPFDAIISDVGKGELAARDIEYQGKTGAAGKLYESKLESWKASQAKTDMFLKIGGQVVKGGKTLLSSNPLGSTAYRPQRPDNYSSNIG